MSASAVSVVTAYSPNAFGTREMNAGVPVPAPVTWMVPVTAGQGVGSGMADARGARFPRAVVISPPGQSQRRGKEKGEGRTGTVEARAVGREATCKTLCVRQGGSVRERERREAHSGRIGCCLAHGSACNGHPGADEGRCDEECSEHGIEIEGAHI